MSQPSNLFPQGHAIGDAFYDRIEERERLKNCFLNHEHTVVVAPRRYGKSSLIRQVLIESNIPGKRIDLLPATNVLFINKALKLCFSELLNQISPPTPQSKQKLIDFVKNLHPKLTLNVLGQKLEVSSTQPAEESVMDLLVGLNAAAKKVNQRVVICFDEFQQISALSNHHAIEAAIRHAVESSTHITYIFSGSNRNLLSQMFSKKSRPLYHLCDLMELRRIKAEIYSPILLAKAKQRWKQFSDEAVIQEILHLTKCHPYYVNALCRQLWKIVALPSTHEVQKIWFDYIATQSNWITDDIGKLTPNQRNIMAALTYMPTAELYAQDFADRVKMGISSIRRAVNTLIKDDFIYKDTDRKYKVLDPAVETYLREIRYFDFLED